MLYQYQKAVKTNTFNKALEFKQGCYVRYFSAKSALRAFNLWGALECVKSALYLLCLVSIKYKFLFDKSRQISINIM